MLFDIDGVIVRPPYYFWKVLEDQWHPNAEEVLNNFFTHENTDCTEWRADITERILPYLEKIWWKQWVQDFFKQQFEFEAQYFDISFIEIVKELQSRDIKCYLASAQEKVRARYFLEEVWFDTIFDGHYISCDVGFRKDKTGYWEEVLDNLNSKYKNLQNHEILFIDDGKKNIEMASEFGLQVFHFTDTWEFRDLIKMIIWNKI